MNDLYKVLTISEWENANENGFIETFLDICLLYTSDAADE